MELLIQQIKQGDKKPARQPRNHNSSYNQTQTTFERPNAKSSRIPNNPQASYIPPNYNSNFQGNQQFNNRQNLGYMRKAEDYQYNNLSQGMNINANYDANMMRRDTLRGKAQNPSYNNRQVDYNYFPRNQQQFEDSQQRRFPLPQSQPPMGYQKQNESYRLNNAGHSRQFTQPRLKENQIQGQHNRNTNFRNNFNRNTNDLRYSPQRNDTRGRGRGRGGQRGRRGRQADRIQQGPMMNAKQAEQRSAKFFNQERNQYNKQVSQYVPKQQKTNQITKNKKQYKKKQSKEEQEQVEQSASSPQYESKSNQIQQQSINESEYLSQQDQQQVSHQSNDAAVNQQQQQNQQQLQQEVQQQSDYENSQEKQTGEQTRMCSKKQFQKRMKTFNQNNPMRREGAPLKLDTSKSFSIFQINKRTNLPDLQLTIKKFQRSVNREQDDKQNEDDQNYVPRNRIGLVRTMEHIKKQVLDSEVKAEKQLAFPMPHGQRKIEFIQIYMFLWDRMREMIKDITRLNEESKSKGEVIAVCEQIARFFILSINEGRKKYNKKLQFDEKNNKQSLTKIMTPLLQIYANAKMRLYELVKQMQTSKQQLTIDNVKKRMQEQGIYISPNEPQITSYVIIFSEEYRKYIYQNLFVGFNVQESNPLFESRQIKQALQIKSALGMKNYAKYFSILESGQCDYLTSCLMTINIEKIRMQISRICQKTFKYVQMSSSKKGVQENDFRKMLHFTNQQNAQYQQFLHNSKAFIGPGGYVSWDEDIKESEKLYVSPQYPILDSKLRRQLFQNQIQQKLPKMMLKTEIVSRSWHKSSYVDQLIYCLIGQQNLIKIKQKEQKTQKIVSLNIEIPKTNNQAQLGVNIEPAIEEDKKLKQNMLNAKMQQINRRKFIQNLSNKLSDLFRPDITKQQNKIKSLKKLLLCFQKKLRSYQMDSISAIQIFCKLKIEKEIYIARFHQFINIKNEYISQFSTSSTSVLVNEKSSCESLTSLLQKSQMGITQILKQAPKQALIEILRNNKIKQFAISIVSDLTKQEQGYNQMNQIVENILTFLIGSIKKLKIKLQNKKYIYKEDDLKISLSLHVINEDDQNWIYFMGCDSIIYLQTKNNSIALQQAFSKLSKIRNCITPLNKYQFPFVVIKLVHSSKIPSFAMSALKPNFESVQFIKTTAKKLGASLQLSLIGFLNQSASKYRKRPALQVQPLSYFFKYIAVNLQYVNNQGKKSNPTQMIMFLYYQQYVNMCVEQIIRISKSYYLAPDAFENWVDVVQDISRQDATIKLEEFMKTQYYQLQNLQISIKMKSPYQVVDNKIILDKNDFSSHYFHYLKKIDFNQKLSFKQILKDVQTLDIQNGTLQGDINNFFQTILAYLYQFLNQFLIAVPVNFKFSLNPKELNSRVSRILQKIAFKTKMKQQKLKQSKSLILKPQLPTVQISPLAVNKQLSYKRRRPNYFKYDKAEWLQQAKKKINIGI